MRAPILTAALAAFLLAQETSALAQETSTASPATATSPAPTADGYPQEESQREGEELRWRPEWRPFGAAELSGTLIAASAAVVLETAGFPSSPGWTGGILFDDALRGALAVPVSSQETMAKISDVLMLTSVSVPIALDALAISLVAKRAPKVSLQMMGISAQAYAMTGTLTGLSKRLVRRQRPYFDGCTADPSRPWCEKHDRFQSFFSGHTSYSFTGAALTCTQHLEMKLLGGPADGLVCAGALTLATTTGLFRILADKHWATDVLVGAVVGGLSGWLFPWLYHFRGGRSAPSPSAAVVVPYVHTEGAGVSYLGSL